jgi:hypothetical protein
MITCNLYMYLCMMKLYIIGGRGGGIDRESLWGIGCPLYRTPPRCLHNIITYHPPLFFFLTFLEVRKPSNRGRRPLTGRLGVWYALSLTLSHSLPLDVISARIEITRNEKRSYAHVKENGLIESYTQILQEIRRNVGVCRHRRMYTLYAEEHGTCSSGITYNLLGKLR